MVQSLTPSLSELRDRSCSLPSQAVVLSRSSTATTAAADETGPHDNPAEHQSQRKDHAAIPSPTPAPSSPVYSQSQPIRIPSIPYTQRDPNRVPTPLSGRGDRKGHLFPFARTPSPAPSQSPSKHHFSPDVPQAQERQHRSSSSNSVRPNYIFAMPREREQLASRYNPSSPLSPKTHSNNQPLSPQLQPQRPRGNHSRQSSRTMKPSLPRFHPANFQNLDPPGTASSAQGQNLEPRQQESPRFMRERQREFIDTLRMSSMVAGSSMGIKPDAPKLNPLGSPKGPVTPLTLEEATDYFQRAVVISGSPVSSPGAGSEESLKDIKARKPKKFSKSDGLR